ncbi:MAG: LAGLIDADG family homing endonuclease [Pseudonocardiaceae bacterium]
MRWDNLTRPDQDALFGVDDVVARTFDTPDFRGMTFYEVRARSIINKVSGASRVPFSWTLNPYRGCSHACRYCLSGDTQILMADGRSAPLADVRVGDAIYGTVDEGGDRRYAVTEVLARWRTVKQAHRVTLDDGTELVASGDHRFLTDLGWKQVMGAGPRPYLAIGDELVGTGRFAAPPQESAGYRRGYLCGMVRGDARVALGLVDRQALRRVGRYFADVGVRTREPALQPAGGSRRGSGMREAMSAGFEAIAEIISWPSCPDEDWQKGFLAGIFDAEGSWSHGALRIVDADSEITESVVSGLARFGFACTIEDSDRPHRLRCVRLLGGLGEQLRFFHTVDPAISRKRSIAGMVADHRRQVVSIEDLGVELPMYDITTGTEDFIANGVVSHNCFARRTHEYLDLDAGLDFDSKIVVKVNAPELLRKELATLRWHALPSATLSAR